MFGYVRPFKSELRICEFQRYRATYCGLCKTIGRRYGQLPRLAVTYDITFLVLLLQSLQERTVEIHEETCVLHPFRKHVVAAPDAPLNLGADYTVLLTWYNLKDDLADGEKIVRSRFMSLALRSAYKKAKQNCSAADAVIRSQLATLQKAEAEGDGATASRAFAGLLEALMHIGLRDEPLDRPFKEALALFGRQLGEWIYLIDALDDQAEDSRSGRWNALAQFAGSREECNVRLAFLEEEMDRICALLPYWQNAEIISNIIQLGLPNVRESILAGESLTKV